jgi:signal transduction histidine kinase
VLRLRVNHNDLLRYAGLFTYGCVGIPLVQESWMGRLSPNDYLGLWISYVAFGISYWWLTSDLGIKRGTPVRWGLLLTMSVAAITISWFSESGLAGILLLVIAGVLPWILPFGWGVAWLLVETMALVPVFERLPGYEWFDAILQSGLYVGFSSFTFITSMVAKEQADAREDQRRLNAELRATRALLAESSRIAERVRISRELHDLVGHHLTALSLNLEVASHLVRDAKAQEHVRQAQSVARLLLQDVREVVSQLRNDDEIDLTKALLSLVEGVPQPRIHLEIPPRFGVDDPKRANVLLRCAQEIITNTIKHAKARNLWLRFERTESNEVVMHARDDGQGVEAFKQGNGLIGMEERLAQFGGKLKIDTGKGQGFALDAWLPLEAS